MLIIFQPIFSGCIIYFDFSIVLKGVGVKQEATSSVLSITATVYTQTLIHSNLSDSYQGTLV